MTGSWANGYDQIPVTVYMCPVHGEVGSSAMALTVPAGLDDQGHIQWFHVGCGSLVQRQRMTQGERSVR